MDGMMLWIVACAVCPLLALMMAKPGTESWHIWLTVSVWPSAALVLFFGAGMVEAIAALRESYPLLPPKTWVVISWIGGGLMVVAALVRNTWERGL